MKRLLLVLGMICLCMASGCFEWTEDSQGSLRSVGLPGMPVWQSKTPEPPLTTSFGLTPDEASKLSKTVLVMPAAPPSRAVRYQFYPIGKEHCQDDLQKKLAERTQLNETGPAPYCTDNPTAPPTKGNALIL